MRHFRETFVGMVAGAAVLLGACNESRDTGAVTSKTDAGTSNAPSAEAVEEKDMALVRVVNAIPGGAAINIYAGDSAAFSAVGYKKATPYREIPDNMFNFQIKSSADRRAPGGKSREPAGGGHYTIVALPDLVDADKRQPSWTRLRTEAGTGRQGSRALHQRRVGQRRRRSRTERAQGCRSTA